ncbi:hypothetical protein [Hyalangium versicolor]|uniref:hypothetical protein n=1 Tax=Hyalangium versicolor TaxID=2861190 RepID=UPI001CCF2F90|nr:hypothetical protein [Hyalangium versicolor]
MGYTVVVHNNHLTFNGIQYFRGGSESVYIGAYGEKKTPLFGQNYLQVQSDLPAAKLVVNSVTTADIDFSKSSAGDVKLGLTVAGGYSGTGDVAFNDLKTGKLKLVKFEMRLGDLATAVNALPDVLANLKRYGNDARVAHQIFVAMEATMAHTFTTSGHLTFNKTGGKLQVSASGGGTTSGTTSVTLSPGTTYAYLLAKVDWNKGKSKVDQFNDDQFGLA